MVLSSDQLLFIPYLNSGGSRCSRYWNCKIRKEERNTDDDYESENSVLSFDLSLLR